MSKTSRINFDELKKEIENNYSKVKDTLKEKTILETVNESNALSNRIPGYNVNMLDYGDYFMDNFVVLQVDMRNSTYLARKGEKKLFLTMYVFLTSLLKVIEEYEGKVVDIMGDGILVFFGGKKTNLNMEEAIKKAYLCGKDMLEVRQKVINPIIKKDNMMEIDLGVGIDYGEVLVTKVGISECYDMMAYGECIDNVDRDSKNQNELHASKEIIEICKS